METLDYKTVAKAISILRNQPTPSLTEQEREGAERLICLSLGLHSLDELNLG